MDTRSSSGDIEHFSISRESFDSYRRSFVRLAIPNSDICDGNSRAIIGTHGAWQRREREREEKTDFGTKT